MSWATERGPDERPKGWWAKTALAGILGGVAMMAFLMVTFAAMGRGAWYPANGVASILPLFQAPGALPSPDFVPGPSLLGLTLHVLASAAFGVIYGGAIEAFAPERARVWYWEALAGLSYGILVWVFSSFGGSYLIDLQDVVFESASFLVAHLIFGMVLGLSLSALTTRSDLLTVTFAPEERPARKPAERR